MEDSQRLQDALLSRIDDAVSATNPHYSWLINPTIFQHLLPAFWFALVLKEG